MAAQVWVPNDAAVAQICKLLTEFQSPTADQAQVWQQLEQARHVPDFNNYLSYVFSKGESLPSDVSVSRFLAVGQLREGPGVVSTTGSAHSGGGFGAARKRESRLQREAAAATEAMQSAHPSIDPRRFATPRACCSRTT